MPKSKAKSQAADNTVENEHIFPQTKLVPMVLHWKELNAQKRHTEAMALLDEIIQLSTPMFERLAQHEEYTNTVDLAALVSVAQEKVVKWILKWEPKKGRLFTWFGKCAKYAFLSELVKENNTRKKYYAPGENLEKFYGIEDHESHKHGITEEFDKSLKDLFCRWGSPQEIGAIRYIVECLVYDLDNHDKQATIRAAAYAYGISFDMSKFFYSWALSALRDLHFKKIRVPFTTEDIVRHCYSYTNFVDLLDYMSSSELMRLIAVKGGQRIKIPTMAQIKKLKDDYHVFEDILHSDKDPDSVADIAKKHRRSQRTAQEAYLAMVEATNPKRSGEYEVYGEDND